MVHGFITGSGPSEIGEVMLLGAGLWIVARLMLTAVASDTDGADARTMLAMSAAAVAPMPLVVLWAGGQQVDSPARGIPAMARIHATVNAVRFSLALAGLVGWAAVDTRGPLGA